MSDRIKQLIESHGPAGESDKWPAYERFKQELKQMTDLASDEFERAIVEYCLRWKL